MYEKLLKQVKFFTDTDQPRNRKVISDVTTTNGLVRTIVLESALGSYTILQSTYLSHDESETDVDYITINSRTAQDIAKTLLYIPDREHNDNEL